VSNNLHHHATGLRIPSYLKLFEYSPACESCQRSAAHADTIFIGPAEESFPRFLEDFRRGEPHKRYVSTTRTIAGCLTVRRDLIKRSLYLVPNSIVVSRGCPHHCDFCYKDAFFAGGRSFYTQRVDVLRDIARSGRHLIFLVISWGTGGSHARYSMG
jgi:radical SAM superfamily enzyme YgiQ (UPF0313 family)